MFQFYKNSCKLKNQSKVWREMLAKREIAKNNYHIKGDLKKANAFADMVLHFTFQQNTSGTEHVIFSASELTVPLKMSYVFAD
jgi:hypothetical protein